MSGNGHPLCIQVHAQDNVAIVANEGGLPSGAQFDSGLRLAEAIPEAHKVALVNIPQGAPIVRYGVVIGYAEAFITKGSWVHEGLMSLPAPPPLDQLPVATAVPEPLPPLGGTPSMASSTTMARSEPGTSSASPPRYSASRPR